ncbi:sialidase family protein [Pedobacter gandavensis]|uniref:exo-alpha-sialidase n=1 Tax=Pedobacter gandavensis TaxID=2679963 RepID=A0ABR6EUW9_9SPHI|nr:sialidase family protein [Pedobacter gandavensis]MBB2148619.1 sialidase [Pedobacter gandavensis]
MIKLIRYIVTIAGVYVATNSNAQQNQIKVNVEQPTLPVLTGKVVNPVLKFTLIKDKSLKTFVFNQLDVSLQGTTNISAVQSLALILDDGSGQKPGPVEIATLLNPKSVSSFIPKYLATKDTTIVWLSVRYKNNTNLSNRFRANILSLSTNFGKLSIPVQESSFQRLGSALRQHMQDGINTSRIPGITTSKKGTLLAIYDGRIESDRDLQGDMDICLNRSLDGGITWKPKQVIMDMKTWGGLPQKYNGVSDANILVDEKTGDIFVIGLWMHGILDPDNGKWVEGLNGGSTQWNHQWRSFGSQPGYDVKQSAQFLIVKSTDDGLTWSAPKNITRQVKKDSWWLLAPAPGHGITLTDGTLVFPTEGRDEKGIQFSTITWSKDGGETWKTGNPAYTNTNECMAVQLSDGSIMLNMRERSNRGKTAGNGRAVAVSKDLGQSWVEHPSSRKTLIEPACMASLHKHSYVENGKKKELLLFLNPNSTTSRNQMTLKVSFDDGNTWPESHWILLDAYNGNGYSCITSIDQKTIGVVYESSQADLAFQQITLKEILRTK